MPIIVEPVVPISGDDDGDLGLIVRAGVSSVDDCPVLTRVRAFLVDQGTTPTLEHVIANRQGNAVDLRPPLVGSGSEPDSPYAIKVRIKEELGLGSYDDGNPLWELDGTLHSSGAGVVRVQLLDKITKRSGIYRLSFGVFDGDRALILNSALLSVERSLFAPVSVVERDQGPLSIQSLRVYLRDSHPNENVRLDDVEFGDEEILAAILRPVEYYNEQPPPIGHSTTRNFPSRYNWSQAAIAKLYEMAAHRYRRNKQQVQSGGLVDDDLNRDQAYESKAQQLWQDFKDWVINDKVMRNARMCVGSIGSVYGGYYGRH